MAVVFNPPAVIVIPGSMAEQRNYMLHLITVALGHSNINDLLFLISLKLIFVL